MGVFIWNRLIQRPLSHNTDWTFILSSWIRPKYMYIVMRNISCWYDWVLFPHYFALFWSRSSVLIIIRLFTTSNRDNRIINVITLNPSLSHFNKSRHNEQLRGIKSDRFLSFQRRDIIGKNSDKTFRIYKLWNGSKIYGKGTISII